MYSIQDVEDMCDLDVYTLSYTELEQKYHRLSEVLMCIVDDKKSLFAKDTYAVNKAYKVLISTIGKVNLTLDYYDFIGKGRRKFV